MARGLFITVEGTDGSGKTTQLGFMRDYLKASGREFLMTREPGGTRISEKIRDITLDPGLSEMGCKTEMLLYAASRAQLVSEVIKPSLERGIIVVCDRYVDSTYAYQGFGRGIDMNALISINEAAVDGIMPDLTFLFDIDPVMALGRRMAATSSDRIENEAMEFHTRVYNGYLRLAEQNPDRIRKIDGKRPACSIWDDVRSILESLM